MIEVPESIAGGIEVVGSLVGTGVFTALGIGAEQVGLHELLAQHTALGLWYGYMGVAALYIGLYVFGYGRLYRRHLAAGPRPR